MAATQMTKGNVGSLLVFDPSKVDLSSDMSKASGDAVVGLITERGMRRCHAADAADSPHPGYCASNKACCLSPAGFQARIRCLLACRFMPIASACVVQIT